MLMHLRRPWAEIIDKTTASSSLQKPNKSLYDKRKEIKINCPFCKAKLKITHKATTYYFSAIASEKHSDECNEILKIFKENHSLLNQTNYNADDLRSLLNTINYFFKSNKHKYKNCSNNNATDNYNKIQNENKFYKITSLQNLKNDISNKKIDINKHYKFIIQAKNLIVENEYFYLNGIDNISLPIGDKYGINNNDIKKLKNNKININNNNYIFCLGKAIINDKNNKCNIYAKDHNLNYIFIDKKNIKGFLD